MSAKKVSSNAVLYGLLAGVALLFFYVGVVSLFRGFIFAFSSLRSLWFFLLPLSAGFGWQIGLYFSIKHTAAINAVAATSGGLSGGAMVVCCSHFLLNIIPVAGASALGTLLMGYQSWFFSAGLLANVFGISLMLRHRKRMKGGKC